MLTLEKSYSQLIFTSPPPRRLTPPRTTLTHPLHAVYSISYISSLPHQLIPSTSSHSLPYTSSLLHLLIPSTPSPLPFQHLILPTSTHPLHAVSPPSLLLIPPTSTHPLHTVSLPSLHIFPST